MIFHPDDPTTWPQFAPKIIAHDVARSRDRATAVVGGNSYFTPQLIGIQEMEELPPKLYGSALASALAAVDRRHNNNALIVVDLSSDASYAEVMLRTFGPRVVGLHITRHGDGMQWERRPVGEGAMLVYTIGRSHLLDVLLRELHGGQVRIAKSPLSQRAYQQLQGLEVEYKESGMIYKCPPGQHDDLGISMAMLVWASCHPHLAAWARSLTPRRPIARQEFGWGAFV